MNKVPCKKCPQCGLFNDFTIEECECGKKLNNIGAQFINTDELSPEQYGEIDVSLKVYVQKCSACGALNYTDNPSNPIKVCYNCHKTRIAAIVPVEYVDTDSSEQEDEDVSESDDWSGDNNLNAHTSQRQTTQVTHSPNVDDDDDDDDDDDYSVQWQGILGNIRKTVGSSPVISQTKPSQQNVKNTIVTPITSDDDDDDDDEVGDWSGILGNKAKQSTTTPKSQVVTPAAKKDITLTAIRYGRLSFTVEAGPNTYMLGRSANQGGFLSQDGRVGNEHCYLFYRNGNWFVKDNNSRNGTAVNSRDIGLNGECMLSNGDELKLGHHNDSVAFRISIG